MKATLFLMGVLICSQATAQCSFTGPKSGSLFSNDNSAGTVSWSNVANAQGSDDIYATAIINADPFSTVITNYLVVKGFGFSIPPSASICGIEVEVEKHYDILTGSLTSVTDYSVMLVQNGVMDGKDKASEISWPSDDVYSIYGGTNDNWEISWTATDINSSSFGVAISATVSSGSSALTLAAIIDHIRITVYYNILLPVTFKDFRAVSEQNRIRLTWATASESGSSYFTAEKQFAGNWVALDSIPAAGNSTEERSYEMFDHSPADINIYRIRQVDADGRFTYSKTARVNFRHGTNIIIRNYPNPAKKVLTVESSSPFTSVLLYDQLGKVVLHKQLAAPVYSTNLSVAQLPPGTYMLVTDVAAKQGARRIIIYR